MIGFSSTTREDIEFLEKILDVPLLCILSSKDCVSDVEWMVDGQCPECSVRVHDRHLCVSCYDFVQQGKTMNHSICGYVGSSSLFYFNFRKI